MRREKRNNDNYDADPFIGIFQLENEVIKCNTAGRECYSLSKMARLVYYAYARGFTSPEVISDFAKNHKFFKYVSPINHFFKIIKKL